MYQQEHNIFRTEFKKFLAREVVPNIGQWEEDRIVPKDIWLKMGASGFLCPWLGEEYGGSEADFLYSVIITEETCKAGAVSMMAPLHSDINVPYIAHLGNDEQKAKWLPLCTSGEGLTAIAMTEPNAGSDLASLKTYAVRDGDDYIINGAKIFISNGINAGLVILAARTNRDVAGAKGISLFVVEDGTPGFTRGRKLDKMGMHSQDTAELVFDDCRVPAANLLGEEGKGFYYMMTHLQQERLMCAIMAQAMAEQMLEMTIEYTQDRKIFGKPVASFQHNAFKIVEMATEIKLGRAFLDQLIPRHMKGEDVVTEVSMAKAWIAEMANRVAYNCVQLHGGYGYMEEYPICRFSRDVRPFAIFAGTTEVMKVIIAKNMGLT